MADGTGKQRSIPLELVYGSGSLLDISVRCLLLLAAVCVVATMLWRLYYECCADPSSNLPLPPGSMGFPLVGEMLSFIMSDYNYNIYRHKKYGFIYKSHLFGQPTINVHGAQNIRRILMGEHIIVDQNNPASTKRLLGSGGVASSSPDAHRLRKKIVLQVLSANSLRRYVPGIQSFIRTSLNEWCGQGELLGQDICKNMTVNLVAEIVLGFKVEKQKMMQIVSWMKTLLANLFTLPWNFPGTGFYKGMKARESIIKAIKENMAKESSVWSVLDDLKQKSKGKDVYTEEEMANALLEFWFAGNDTTASTISSVLMFLGKDQRLRQNIEKELEEFNLLDTDTELSYDLLMKLTYVDHVVKEVLRMYPAAAGNFRKAKSTIEIGGYQIPKGWQILYGITDTHMYSELFSQTGEFLPERWPKMEPQLQDINNKFDYVPFGAGARQCPGRVFAAIVVKTFIVVLTRTCHWELKNKTTKMLYFPMPHPVDGLPVTFTLRKNEE